MKTHKTLKIVTLVALTVSISAACNNNKPQENKEIKTSEQSVKGQNTQIPSVYSGIEKDGEGKIFFDFDGKKYYLKKSEPEFVFDDFDEIESGNDKGILLSFKKNFEGKVLYGLFPDEKSKYPRAVFFKKYASIKDGKALLDISRLHGKYDIANWEQKGYGSLEYRVLTSDNRVITNKKVNFRGRGPFELATTVITGPILSQLTQNSVVISCDLNQAAPLNIIVDGKKFSDGKTGKHHEITITGLTPSTEYDYTIDLKEFSETHTFKTAPVPGSQESFTFAFASDSRGGLNVGETNTYGTNAYIMRKLAAFLTTRDIAFWQFTGDMISGYKDNDGQQILEYTNWYRTLSDYLYGIPLNVGMGNHEAHLDVFDFKSFISVDKFPFDKNSAEALFSRIASNPLNGPQSEDGAAYDPDTSKTDFPPYKESVYSYTYGNTAMIVLNSNYLYTPREDIVKNIGGNIHGYIMDKQLQWLKSRLLEYEKDKNIDHVFVTIHTPAFPNGGHSDNDMWYEGNNEIRPYIAGKAVKKGIIERRDEFLNILVNESSKFRALLTGDEHNYSRITVNNQTEIYPENYKGEKIKLKRPFVQITDGSAGAPYYGQEKLPWSSSVDKFSVQYAVVLFNIRGKSVEIEVVNPVTFELIEKVKLN